MLQADHGGGETRGKIPLIHPQQSKKPFFLSKKTRLYIRKQNHTVTKPQRAFHHFFVFFFSFFFTESQVQSSSFTFPYPNRNFFGMSYKTDKHQVICKRCPKINYGNMTFTVSSERYFFHHFSNLFSFFFIV